MTGQAIRGVRLCSEAIEAILDRLDEKADPAAADQRKTKRFSYRSQDVILELPPTGAGTAKSFICASRDLSNGGCSFLHGGFVHPGAKCIVHLAARHGKWQRISARIVHCRFVEGSVHEIGVQFDEPIDASMFCAAAVTYHMLLLMREPSVARVTEHRLKQNNIDLDVSQNPEVAFAFAMQFSYVAIMTDSDPDEPGDVAFIQRLRDAGFGGRYIVLTAGDAAGGPRTMERLGFDGFLHAPITDSSVAQLLRDLDAEPVVSSLHGEAGLRELLASYVAELPTRMKAVRSALQTANEDTSALVGALRSLGESSQAYGFDVISKTAHGIEHALARGDAFASVVPGVVELARLVSLARA